MRRDKRGTKTYVLLGLIFIRHALRLIGDVRRARRQGQAVPRPFLNDPNDP